MVDTVMPIFGIPIFIWVAGWKHQDKSFWPGLVFLGSMLSLLYIGMAFNGLNLFMRTCDYSLLPPPPPRPGAVQVTVGQTKIELTAPDGYCALDRKHNLDSQVLTAAQIGLEGHNTVLGVFWPCAALDAARESKLKFVAMNDALQYQVSHVVKDRILSASAVRDLCDSFRKQAPELSDEIKKHAAAAYNKLKERAIDMIPGTMTMYGVLAQDDSACYFGQILKGNFEGRDYTKFIVAGTALIKSKAISSYFQAELTDESTIKRLLDLSQKNVAALRERNP